MTNLLRQSIIFSTKYNNNYEISKTVDLVVYETLSILTNMNLAYSLT